MGDAEPLAGRVLAEKYLLIDRLGEGGFGSIWRAEHQVLRSEVAVKLIDLDVARKEGAVERFLREAQATAALRSPHVVQVLDYGVDGDQPFIVMELLEGENLAVRIERDGALAPIDAVRIVTHVARAIGKAHELGIVHRDLKPENIFLVKNGDEEIAKVLDFGVAKIAAPVDFNQDTYTITGSLIGTPYYMSPEQAQGNKAVDHRSDLWALGVIAFEMLTAKRPFDGDALGDLVLTICVRSIAIPSAVASVPVGFDAWFAKAVERDPEARFQSASELASALLQVVGGESSEVRYTGLEDRVPQRSATGDSGVGFDLPSRPAAAAFAATIRDEALTAGILANHSLPPAPADPTQLLRVDELVEEEHLTPWSLFGIAVMALAAGAAAVYGLFFLLRAHESSNETLETSATAEARATAPYTTSGASRQRFEVNATNRSSSGTDASAAKARPAAAEPSAVASAPSANASAPSAPVLAPSASVSATAPLPPPQTAASASSSGIAKALPLPELPSATPIRPLPQPLLLAPESAPTPAPTPIPALPNEHQPFLAPTDSIPGNDTHLGTTQDPKSVAGDP